MLESFLETASRALAAELRLRAGLLYAEGRDAFVLKKTVGQPGGPVAETLSSTAAPALRSSSTHRVYIFGEPEAETSPSRLGLFPRPASAALLVGRRPKRHVLFFLLGEGWVREELDFTLNTVRAALGSRLTDERVRGSVREAAEIQQSLLVEEPPHFPGFEHRLPLRARRGGGRRLLRLPRTSGGRCWGSPSATPAATACPRPCWCATW